MHAGNNMGIMTSLKNLLQKACHPSLGCGELRPSPQRVVQLPGLACRSVPGAPAVGRVQAIRWGGLAGVGHKKKGGHQPGGRHPPCGGHVSLS